MSGPRPKLPGIERGCKIDSRSALLSRDAMHTRARFPIHPVP